MIRKAVIVTLTLTAVGTGALGLIHYTDPSGHIDFRPPAGPSNRGWENPFWIRLERGKFFLGHSHYVGPPATPWSRRVTEELPFGYNFNLRPMRSADSSAVYCWFVLVWAPAWTVPMFFAAYPIIALIRGPLRRWRRHRKGLCLKCGYDLEGNVSGVCPECGRACAMPLR